MLIARALILPLRRVAENFEQHAHVFGERHALVEPVPDPVRLAFAVRPLPFELVPWVDRDDAAAMPNHGDLGEVEIPSEARAPLGMRDPDEMIVDPLIGPLALAFGQLGLGRAAIELAEVLP